MLVLMCGSHPRHLYIANKLYENGLLSGLVIEKREEFIPSPPAELSEIDRNNFIYHFEQRNRSEENYFSQIDTTNMFLNIPNITVSKDELNSKKTLDFLSHINAEYLISYGVHKLSDELLEIYQNKCFNIHGGLSPWYKGNTTLFWPFYFLRPNWAGMTIHRLSNQMDAGEILHHSVPQLEKGDKLHDVSCKCVVQVSNDLIQIFENVKKGEKLSCYPQRSNGKLFIESDWKPEMLRLVYNVYQDDLVDQFLEGNISSEPPKLIKAV